MSYKYSKKSQKLLKSCHPDIQKVFNEAIKHMDITILEGLRTKETQEEYVRTGKSKTMNSKHLDQGGGVSHAIDAAPFPISWENERRFTYFGGIIMGIAMSMGIELRWGGDWDGDKDPSDQTFNDLVHFELRCK